LGEFFFVARSYIGDEQNNDQNQFPKFHMKRFNCSI